MEEETTREVTSALTNSEDEAETSLTTTTTAISYPYEEQVTIIRGDLDLIAGLLVAFMVIELCKWSYRFLNIFFPI